MAAEIENKHWKLRSKSGREKLFKTPSSLRDAAIKYFKHCEDNPWLKIDFKGKDADRVEIPTAIPFTIKGLCNFLGVNAHYFNDFKAGLVDKLDPNTEKYDQQAQDFSDVISYIEQIIYVQKYTGAAVGAFNANLISADLGIAMKHNHNLQGTVTHVITGMEIK